ncbi:MAG: thioredoxin [Terracidiphilus sp.]
MLLTIKWRIATFLKADASHSGQVTVTLDVRSWRKEKMMAGVGVLEVNDATFDQEVLKSELPVLVDFWAVWCGPCKAIAPIVDSVATTHAGKLKVAKVNVDENGATPSRFGIRGIPALLFFKGGKVADQVVGFVPQDVIEEKIKRLLA